MAVNQTNVQFAYGLGQALIPMAPIPIRAQRAPGLTDLAQLGQLWVDVPASQVYALASITSNVPSWILLESSGGAGVFSSLVVNPGNATITAGNLVVSAGSITTTVGDVTVGGTLHAAAIASAAAITATATTAINLVAPTGLNVTTGGLTSFDAGSSTVASPTAAVTINTNVGAATFTGFTTATVTEQVFTINNSLVTATSRILVSIANEGSNDAQMAIARVKRAAGSFAVTTINDGAAALNGNVTVTFFVLS